MKRNIINIKPTYLYIYHEQHTHLVGDFTIVKNKYMLLLKGNDSRLSACIAKVTPYNTPPTGTMLHIHTYMVDTYLLICIHYIHYIRWYSSKNFCARISESSLS